MKMHKYKTKWDNQTLKKTSIKPMAKIRHYQKIFNTNYISVYKSKIWTQEHKFSSIIKLINQQKSLKWSKMSMNSSCNKTISNRIKQYRMLCKMPFSNFKSKTVVPIRCRKVHRPRNKKVKVLNSVKQPTTTNRIPILMRSQHRKKKRRSSRFLDRVESMLKFVITSYRPGQIRMHSNSWRRMMWNNKIFNNS